VPTPFQEQAVLTELERVLHVEDDPSIILVTRVTLQKLGKMQVLSCESGKIALEKAAAFNPQLILLDVMMPGMDGPTTLLELGKLMNLDQVLVLFMTAKVQDAEIDHYHSIGARGVIIKPFDPMTLVGQLQQHWQQFRQEKD
jgi:two-component system, OmpR family, response regulator